MTNKKTVSSNGDTVFYIYVIFYRFLSRLLILTFLSMSS